MSGAPKHSPILRETNKSSSCISSVCCFDDTPPDTADARGVAGQKYSMLLGMQDRPNSFQTNLFDAPCAAPCTCLIGTLLPCLMAPVLRQKSLNALGGGIGDYVCCQGYIPACCCFDFPNMGRGSLACLWLEGCCCDSLSISFTRIFVMERKDLHPDPADYQIIRFSNCVQMVACVCDLAICITSMFIDRDSECNEYLHEFKICIDVTAECVLRVVLGCMGAQIAHEIGHSKEQQTLLNGAQSISAQPVCTTPTAD